MIKAIPSGESHTVLFVLCEDTASCVRAVRRLFGRLRALQNPHILSVRPALDSVAIEHTPEFRLQDLDLQALDKTDSNEESQQETLRIPVCYEAQFAPDLEAVLEQTGLRREDFMALHTSQLYRVWMLGFMPGFPYLGALPPELVIPRKPRPSQKVPQGSVAVAEEFTGIYPFESPGGWHVIGRTPLKITEYTRTPPFLFQFGMQVQFYPVTIEEYGRIKGADS